MLSAVTVVILLGEERALDVDDLDALTVVPPPGEAPLAARVCAEITRLAPEPPLVIVAAGDQAALLPSVALAQRAARRRVAAYVLVDPQYPEVCEGWPDARVHVLGSPEFALRTAELRGWETGPVTGLRDVIHDLESGT
jgi:hypothetical protein